MELNYKIKLKQKENSELQNNLLNLSPLQTTNIFNYDGLIEIISNSENISQYFEETNTRVDVVNRKENFILGYEKSDKFTENSDIDFSQEFLSNILNSKYHKNLTKVINLEFDKIIDYETKYELLERDEENNIFELIDKDLYSINYETSKIITEFLPSNKNYFLFTIKDFFKLKKSSNNLVLKKEDILNLNSGFYQIKPQIKNKGIKDFKEETSDYVKIFSKDTLQLKSDFNINFDQCITNSFILSPYSSVEIKYTAIDFTPLNIVSTFDPLKEYIIFEVENNAYIPKFFLSSEVESSGEFVAEFDLLMQSHEEFKKPFLVISNYATLELLNKNEIKIIHNKDFSKLKEDSLSSSTLTIIKI